MWKAREVEEMLGMIRRDERKAAPTGFDGARRLFGFRRSSGEVPVVKSGDTRLDSFQRLFIFFLFLFVLR